VAAGTRRYHIFRIVVAEWTAALERHPGHRPSFTGAVDRAANRLGLELDATDVQLPGFSTWCGKLLREPSLPPLADEEIATRPPGG
jgi:hypothetical protein